MSVSILESFGLMSLITSQDEKQLMFQHTDTIPAPVRGHTRVLTYNCGKEYGIKYNCAQVKKK